MFPAAGMGIGARIAAVVAGKCRGVMSGYALLSYPLQVTSPPCEAENVTNTHLAVHLSDVRHVIVCYTQAIGI